MPKWLVGRPEMMDDVVLTVHILGGVGWRGTDGCYFISFMSLLAVSASEDSAKSRRSASTYKQIQG